VIDPRQDSHSTTQLERAKRSARRTALLLAGIAVVIYVGFLAVGMLGK
jgi:hypothetical protein